MFEKVTYSVYSKTMEDQIIRRYYLLKEVAIRLRESIHTIKFWMRKFDMEVLKQKGRRNYIKLTEDQLATLHDIQRLVHVRRFTIEGAIMELQDARFDEDIKNSLRVLC